MSGGEAPMQLLEFVDLGFENLGPSAAEHRGLMMAFGAHGIEIPGTQLRMRFVYPHAEIEQIDAALREGTKLDYWFIDAGWYPCAGSWAMRSRAMAALTSRR